MEQNTNIAANEADPLAMPGSPSETDYPLLKPAKIYRFSVRSIELVDAKKEGVPPGAQNAKIVLSTTKDELDTRDNVLHAGFTVTKYIPMYAAGMRTMQNVRTDLLNFIFAVEGKASKTPPAAVRDTPERFIGKPIDGKVSIQEDKTGQYGPSNAVKFVIAD